MSRPLIKNLPRFISMDEITADFRWAGPSSCCPNCQQRMAQTMLSLDPNTLDVGMYLLDAVCVECAGVYRLACQADSIPLEPGVEEEEQE